MRVLPEPCFLTARCLASQGSDFRRDLGEAQEQLQTLHSFHREAEQVRVGRGTGREGRGGLVSAVCV